MSTMGDIGRQLLGIVLGGACVFSASCATAQITPDRTLPNNSNVTNNGSVFNITGGTQAGRNLFHSFQQFSVPTGSTASFNNGLDIQNIFSRVTGGIVSNIDGLIKANGTANLFLINPSGIIFGPNASLGLNGSFFASTANSLVFGNGFEFSATNPQAPPLLTVNIPIGLRFRDNPGSIQLQGDGQGIRTTSNLIDTTTGLRVQPNQTLALVGGNINLEGATLKTAGGRIELGSVAGNGLVSLTAINKGFSLGYGEVQNFGNIQLSKLAAVDASGEGGGDIQVWGRNVTLTDGSRIEAFTLGSKPGGSLVVNAQNSVQLISTSGLFVDVYEGATGAGGNLTINTHQLAVLDGAQVSTGTNGAGKGGNLSVAADLIALRTSSGLFAQADPGSTGDAGNLTINTGQLVVLDGAQVSASTNGAGKGGDLTINTQYLRVQNGATVSVSSPQGQAGDLIITAKNILLNLGSITAETGVTSPNQSEANIRLQGFDLLFLGNNSLISAQATSNTANGGNITIDAPNGLVFFAVPSRNNDGSGIVATASGGQGGDVKIAAQGIFGLTPVRSIFRNGTNYIYASSELDVNTVEVGPIQPIVELSEKVVDPTTQIAQNPCQRGAGSSFTIIGRGGLPPSPDEPQTSDVVWTDTRLPATTSQHQHKTHAAKPKPQPIAIIPATGWVFNDKRQVVLTAYDPTNTGSQRSWREPASCNQR